MKCKYKNKFLSNNNRFYIEHPEYRKVFLLNIILIIIIIISFYFALTNFLIKSDMVLSLINLMAISLSFATLIFFHRTDNINITTILTIFSLTAFLIFYLAVSKNECYALYWVSVYPPVLYVLINKKKAHIITSLFLLCLFIYIYFSYENWKPTEFNLDAVANIISATFASVLLISYVESNRSDIAIALKERNCELKESKDQLRLILDSSGEAIAGIDTNGNCTFCNSICLELLGYRSQNELLGQNMHFKAHHTRKDGRINPFNECKITKTISEGRSARSNDEIFWRADGTSFDVEYSSFPQFKDGKIIGAVISFRDITEKRKNEEKIIYLSCHDPLTGLFNRSSLDEKLKEIDKQENLPITIIFGDVNGLKMTNDIFGHSAGDTLLIKTSEILKNVCRTEDILYRVGGDEFIILMLKTDMVQAKEVIGHIKSELADVKATAIKCCISMGCETKTNMSQDLEIVMGNAENEMYKEKIRDRKSINCNMINKIIESYHATYPREKQHSESVSELCYKIARAMNLSESEAKKAKDAGFLHDIGKVALKENLIRNKDFLNEEEKKAVQQHSVIGYRILNLFDDKLDLAEGVYSHHEWWDGSGYPKGLKATEIPFLSRIIAVAEEYDAMINDITIHSVSKEVVLDKIRSLSGIRLDPELTGVFISMMSKEKSAR